MRPQLKLRCLVCVQKNTSVFSLMERRSVWTQEEMQEGENERAVTARLCRASCVPEADSVAVEQQRKWKNAEIKCKKRCKDQQNSFPPEQIT